MKKTTRKEREKQRHSEEIMRAAEAVFAEKGYVHAKMSDIAEAAEFSVGYIYNIWKSKKDLYLSVLYSKMKDFGSYVEQQIAATNNPYEKINLLMDAHFTFFEKHQAFFKIYISEESQTEVHLFKPFGEKFRRHKAEMFQKVEDIFKEGIDAGIFIPVAAEDLTTAMKGILFAFTINMAENDSLQYGDDKREAIKKIFFGSILRREETTEGLELS